MRHTPLRDFHKNPMSHVVLTACSPPCTPPWRPISLPLFYRWVSWGVWRGGDLSRGTHLMGESPGLHVVPEMVFPCFCKWLHAFSAHVSLNSKGLELAFEVLLCLQSFLTVVKGGGGTVVDASCMHQMLRFLGNTWEEYVVLVSSVLTGSACSTVKFTVFSVCQNLMTFRRPGTYLLKKLLLCPYHPAPGAMGRSLIAQWYWYNREQLVGWWPSALFSPLCSASFRTALDLGSGTTVHWVSSPPPLCICGFMICLSQLSAFVRSGFSRDLFVPPAFLGVGITTAISFTCVWTPILPLSLLGTPVPSLIQATSPWSFMKSKVPEGAIRVIPWGNWGFKAFIVFLKANKCLYSESCVLFNRLLFFF